MQDSRKIALKTNSFIQMFYEKDIYPLYMLVYQCYWGAYSLKVSLKFWSNLTSGFFSPTIPNISTVSYTSLNDSLKSQKPIDWLNLSALDVATHVTTWGWERMVRCWREWERSNRWGGVSSTTTLKFIH